MNESDVFECLETVAQELGTPLGYSPNTVALSCGQISEHWLNKTTGAGLTSENAALFLAYRLAEELWELQEVHPLPVADSMSRILASFSNLKRTNGFFTGFNSITLSSSLAEVPDGCPYEVLHSQDIGDLEAHGSCHIVFSATTEEGALALQWEEVRAEYLVSNQRNDEATDARARARVFHNQLQESCDG